MADKIPYNRQELVSNVTDAINNVLDHMEKVSQLVDGNVLMEDLGRDERGHHFRLEVNWYLELRNPAIDEEKPVPPEPKPSQYPPQFSNALRIPSMSTMKPIVWNWILHVWKQRKQIDDQNLTRFNAAMRTLDQLYAPTPEEVKAQDMMKVIGVKISAAPDLNDIMSIRVHPDFIDWAVKVERTRRIRLDPLSGVSGSYPTSFLFGILIYRDREVPYGDCVLESWPK